MVHPASAGAMVYAGVAGLQPAIDDLRAQLAAPPAAAAAPNWAGLDAIIRRPGVLEAATNAELRAVLLELVDQILYIGDPDRVEIRLRDSTGRDLQ